MKKLALVLFYGAITGIATSVIITLYKFCAKHAIHLSELGYEQLAAQPLWLIAVIPALAGVAFLLHIVYNKAPDLKGGGIPSSIGILRGLITFKWLRTLIGTFVLSLSSFLIGVPLGNEGPSVQMGTAMGRACLRPAKKLKTLDRYMMTGGACAGFAAATGAPISGVMFAIEEAHQRISPMIILIASISVTFCQITTRILAPIAEVSTSLFPSLDLIALTPKDIWLPFLVGGIMGLFAVAFLNYFKLLNCLMNKKLGAVKSFYKIFAVLTATVILGICSIHFISTGHEMILELLEGKIAFYMLFLILIVRATLTVLANSGGITGGIFLPTLAIGATMSAIIAECVTELFGLDPTYYDIILVMGITACISGMMKMPLTAIVFAIEALSFYNNVVYTIAVVFVAYIITEIFGTKSINDTVLENKVASQNERLTKQVIDTFVTVKSNSFAVGKQIRDILWPANLFVLSHARSEAKDASVDEHGGEEIEEGDILHIRYMTYDEKTSREDIVAIVGEQDYEETPTEII